MARKAQHRTVLTKCRYVRKDSGRSSEEKYVFEHNGVAYALTSCPHGRDEIKKGTFRQILRQMHLTSDEYAPFYRCTGRHADYLKILARKSVICGLQ